MGQENEDTTVTNTSDGVSTLGEKKPVLVVLSGMSLGRSIRIERSSCVIGRAADADLVLDDDGISRKHAKVVLLPKGIVMVQDLGSTNGVFVNGQRVESYPLEDGDRIRLGANTTIRFVFEDDIEVNLRQHLFTAATRDGLTGAHNRRSFEEQLLRVTAQSRRHKQPLSLIVFDLDHFKKINDTYGHVVGDETLQGVARRVLETIRLEDCLARIGGEEFAVLLPGIDGPHGVLAAERIRQVVCSLPFSGKQATVSVTVSLGVCQFQPDIHDRPEALLSAADAFLYEAKHAGRNCVMPPPPVASRLARDRATLVDGNLIRASLKPSDDID